MCEIVLSGQRSRSLQVQSEDLTEAQKKKIKPTSSPQHDHSTIPNKHRKMLNHNFYCSIIRRQFKGNIATYILGELSQGLQNYFQYLKEKIKMLITQKLDHPEREDGCKCSQKRPSGQWHKLNVRKTKGERCRKMCLLVPQQPEECGANLVETSGTGLNFHKTQSTIINYYTYTEKVWYLPS